jgi:GrpB-like predicted nucleotidyltransferase (UPF0157 family)
MPFPDELHLVQVEVQPYREQWAAEGAAFAAQLREFLPGAVSVEHIGSTSIPGMAAKDCLDMMVLVEDIAGTDAKRRLVAAGYRRRPEPWNNHESADGRSWPKMVFAPPVGGRQVNIHIRVAGTPTARLALLFRDYLRANSEHAQTWSSFKLAAATACSDLAVYGAIKAPAWRLLMELAEHWAAQAGWQPRISSGQT